MSVPKSQRNLSKLEVYNNAVKLRKRIAQLLMRDFGIRNKDRYPEWLLENSRVNILNLLHDLIANITSANAIYPTIPMECDERRIYKNRAMADCDKLLQEFQFIIDVCNVDANKYVNYVDAIVNERNLLKAWRSGDNKTDRKIKNAEK